VQTKGRPQNAERPSGLKLYPSYKKAYLQPRCSDVGADVLTLSVRWQTLQTETAAHNLVQYAGHGCRPVRPDVGTARAAYGVHELVLDIREAQLVGLAVEGLSQTVSASSARTS
jgi:hypothetical protein